MDDMPTLFFCGRDHPRGPGAWCVFGPDGFRTVVGDRQLGIMLAHLLCGYNEDAVSVATEYCKALKDGWKPAE